VFHADVRYIPNAIVEWVAPLRIPVHISAQRPTVLTNPIPTKKIPEKFNTLRTGDADLRFYITTVQDG